MFLTFRDKGSAFIKGHQLTVKIAGIFCILAFERSRKEIVYIENTIHEFAKRFRIIKPALFPFLNLSEHRATDAQGGIFYRFIGGKLFLTLLFDSRDKLPTLFSRKKAVQTVVNFIQLFLDVRDERGRIDIREIFGLLFGRSIDFLT